VLGLAAEPTTGDPPASHPRAYRMGSSSSAPCSSPHGAIIDLERHQEGRDIPPLSHVKMVRVE